MCVFRSVGLFVLERKLNNCKKLEFSLRGAMVVEFIFHHIILIKTTLQLKFIN